MFPLFYKEKNMKKIIYTNLLLFIFFNMFSFNIFANEINIDDLFRDDASVYSTEENEEIKEENKISESNKNTIENSETTNIEDKHGIKEEIVLELEKDIVYEDKEITKDNTFIVFLISSLLIVATIIIGVFITIKNSK